MRDRGWNELMIVIEINFFVAGLNIMVVGVVLGNKRLNGEDWYYHRVKGCTVAANSSSKW